MVRVHARPPENMIDSTRTVSVLIPIKIEFNKLFVHLQKRAADAKRAPNFFAFWGGGKENGETPEQTLIREIKEELGIDLDTNKIKFFYSYEFFKSRMDTYYLEVGDGWENNIEVIEGQYGQWFIVEEALEREDISFQDKTVLDNLKRELLGNGRR